MEKSQGCTIWIYGHGGDEEIIACASRLSEEFKALDLPFEEIDAAAMARRSYKEKASWLSLSMAIGFTTHRLNKHGVHVILLSAKGPSSGFSWGKNRPQRMLDVVLDGDAIVGESPTPTVRLDTTRDLDDQGLEQVHVDVSTIIDGLGKMGWLGGPPSEATLPVDDKEIRDRLEKLGYL